MTVLFSIKYCQFRKCQYIMFLVRVHYFFFNIGKSLRNVIVERIFAEPSKLTSRTALSNQDEMFIYFVN